MSLKPELAALKAALAAAAGEQPPAFDFSAPQVPATLGGK